jgi:D-alanyl-D-alanine carboxypeptidase (penicillin-binding protein 5/6)
VKLEKLRLVLGVLIVFLIIYMGVIVQSGAAKKEEKIEPIAVSGSYDENPKEPESVGDSDVEVIDSEDKKDFKLTLNEDNYTVFDESIISAQAILVDLENEKVLGGKDIHKACYPASLTKILTTYTAIKMAEKYGYSLEDTVALPEEMFAPLFAQDSSMAGFAASEEVKLIDLLYGSMLPSGGDATGGLAYFFCSGAGSFNYAEQSFVDIMNEYAEEMGALNTHFVTTSGLHDENHYTTAYDTAVILTQALKDETFREIFCYQDIYRTSPTAVHPEGVTFIGNFWHLRFGNEDPRYTIIGAKTGYTDQAKRCLATLAVKDGKEYIAISMACDYFSDLSPMYADSI